MSIGPRAVGIGTVLAVVGALFLGWRHQRTPGLVGTLQAESSVEEGI
jgi:hypothetical protein